VKKKVTRFDTESEFLNICFLFENDSERRLNSALKKHFSKKNKSKSNGYDFVGKGQRAWVWGGALFFGEKKLIF